MKSDIDVQDRPADLPMTVYAAKLATAVGNLKGRPRHCAVSAFVHLKKAWKLMPRDPEMAHFRAITAEEEAAASLFFAYKVRGYENAGNLKWRNHLQKSAVLPFIAAVARVIELPEEFHPVQAKLNTDIPRIDVHMTLSQHGGWIVQIDNPLNFYITQDGNPNFVQAEFKRRFDNIVRDRGYDDILQYLKDEANIRNSLLYADDDGYPVVRTSDGFVLERLRRVVIVLSVAMIIMQDTSRQPVAAAALETFLKTIQTAKQRGLLQPPDGDFA